MTFSTPRFWKKLERGVWALWSSGRKARWSSVCQTALRRSFKNFERPLEMVTFRFEEKNKFWKFLFFYHRLEIMTRWRNVAPAVVTSFVTCFVCHFEWFKRWSCPRLIASGRFSRWWISRSTFYRSRLWLQTLKNYQKKVKKRVEKIFQPYESILSVWNNSVQLKTVRCRPSFTF